MNHNHRQIKPINFTRQFLHARDSFVLFQIDNSHSCQALSRVARKQHNDNREFHRSKDKNLALFGIKSFSHELINIFYTKFPSMKYFLVMLLWSNIPALLQSNTAVWANPLILSKRDQMYFLF